MNCLVLAADEEFNRYRDSIPAKILHQIFLTSANRGLILDIIPATNAPSIRPTFWLLVLSSPLKSTAFLLYFIAKINLIICCKN